VVRLKKRSAVLLVHGGAWAIPDPAVESHLNGVRAALEAGWRALGTGGSALDAVEAAIASLEDDETFDAGRGSFLNRDGKVQLDAFMMDGQSLRAGGVGCVERIKNPIRVARTILEKSPHVYFVGEGAERFAEEHGISLIENSELVLEREVERWRNAKEQKYLTTPEEFCSPTSSHDTVGAVALDGWGNIAGATSTGGTLNKAPGRVGDSSLIGCGCYADNDTAAASTTGWGEPMMKVVLSKWATDRVGYGDTPEKAAREAIHYLHRRVHGHGGIILLDGKGRTGVAHNTPRMAWGVRRSGGVECAIEAKSDTGP
jgi:beta-aspartyl-peptidase (threonine type)